MGRYKDEDIAGVQNDQGQIWCRKCMSEDDWKELLQVNIITADEIEKSGGDEYIFCDQCGKRL